MNYDYRRILKSELEERILRNSSYSLRSFAKDLGVQAPKLSEVLNYKKGISESVAEKVCDKLTLNKSEKKKFILSVLSQHSRSPAKKERAQFDLLNELRSEEKNYLKEDQFKLISSWYHYAILELLCTKEIFKSENEISRRLGLSAFQVKTAIERLINLGLVIINKDQSFKVTSETSFTSKDVPSKALKSHHESHLDLAKKALYEQEVNQREISSTTLAFKQEKIQEVKTMMRDFRKKIAAMADNTSDNDSVYLLSTLFFRLDKETNHDHL